MRFYTSNENHQRVDSQDRAGLEIFLIHPFRLAYFQDLRVTQVLKATLELIQRIRLESQRSHDLLPHHLHYLQRTGTTALIHRGCMWRVLSKTCVRFPTGLKKLEPLIHSGVARTESEEAERVCR